MAFDAGEIVIQLTAAAEALQKGLGAALTSLKNFGDGAAKVATTITNAGRKMSSALLSPISSITRLTRRMLSLRNAVVAVVAFRLFKFFVTEPALAAKSLNLQAQSLGITAQKLAAYRFAVEAAGGKADDFNEGLSNINQNLFGAFRGIARSAVIFKELGIDIAKLSGEAKTAEEIFLEVFDAFDKGKVSIEDLKKAGIEQLAVVFSQGRDSFQALLKESVDLGVIPSSLSFAKLAQQFNGVAVRFKAALGLIAQAVSTVVLPSLLTLANKFNEVIKANSSNIKAFAAFAAQEIARVFTAIGNALDNSKTASEALLKVLDALVKFVSASVLTLLDFIHGRGIDLLKSFMGILASLIGPAFDQIGDVTLAKIERTAAQASDLVTVSMYIMKSLVLKIGTQALSGLLHLVDVFLRSIADAFRGLANTKVGDALGVDVMVAKLDKLAKSADDFSKKAEASVKSYAEIQKEAADFLDTLDRNTEHDFDRKLADSKRKFESQTKTLIEVNAETFRKESAAALTTVGKLFESLGINAKTLIEDLGKAIKLETVPVGKSLEEFRKEFESEKGTSLSEIANPAPSGQSAAARLALSQMQDLAKATSDEVEALRDSKTITGDVLDFTNEWARLTNLVAVAGEKNADALLIEKNLVEKHALLSKRVLNSIKEELKLRGENLDLGIKFESNEERIMRFIVEKREQLKKATAEDQALFEEIVPELELAGAQKDFAEGFSKPFADAVGRGITEGILQGKPAMDILLDVANNLFADFLNNAVKELQTQFVKAINVVFGAGGEQFAQLLGALVGVAAALYAKRKGSFGQTFEEVKSQVESTQAIRGIVAGPTDIAISAVGDSIEKAFRGTEARLDISNLLLQQIRNGITGGGGGSGSGFDFAGSVPTT